VRVERKGVRGDINRPVGGGRGEEDIRKGEMFVVD
jgi:hypothetical protein